jgi:hypothetical protein
MRYNKWKMVAVGGLVLLAASPTAHAIKAYKASIPNGSVNSCSACHTAAPKLNSFGTDFSQAGNSWSPTLASLDSDGDGFTNGQELGDPTGAFTPIAGAQVTNPGDTSSKPVPAPPTIVLSSPADAASFSAPYLGPITAEVGGSAQAVAKVDFLEGTTLLGSVTSPPFSLAVNLPAGTYSLTARVTDYLNATADSAKVTIQVTSASIPLSIAQQPLSQKVSVGDKVVLSVVANGNPPLTYQWKKDAVDIDKAVEGSLTLASATTSDQGSYTVTVSSGTETLTSDPAILTVEELPVLPVIVTQPGPQIVKEGDAATFTVVAKGTPPLTYQWQKDGSAVPEGISPTLTIAKVVPGDAGSYRVIVSGTGPGLSVTSEAATLTVTTPPPPPVVSQLLMLAPKAGSVHILPTTIRLVAQTQDPALLLSQVEFYAGDKSLGKANVSSVSRKDEDEDEDDDDEDDEDDEELEEQEDDGEEQGDDDEEAPAGTSGERGYQVYTLSWTPELPGSYDLSAKGLDSAGLPVVSAVTAIQVVGADTTKVRIGARDPIAHVEGETGAQQAGSFQVRREGPVSSDLTVLYGVGGTAVAGVDYEALPGTVTILAGHRSAKIAVQPKINPAAEPGAFPTLTLTILPSSEAVAGAGYYVPVKPDSASVAILQGKPRDPGCRHLEDGEFHVSLPHSGQAGYRLEVSNDLINWTPVLTNPSTAAGIQYLDPEAKTKHKRFYRAVPTTVVPPDND